METRSDRQRWAGDGEERWEEQHEQTSCALKTDITAVHVCRGQWDCASSDGHLTRALSHHLTASPPHPDGEGALSGHPISPFALLSSATSTAPFQRVVSCWSVAKARGGREEGGQWFRPCNCPSLPGSPCSALLCCALLQCSGALHPPTALQGQCGVRGRLSLWALLSLTEGEWGCSALSAAQQQR